MVKIQTKKNIQWFNELQYIYSMLCMVVAKEKSSCFWSFTNYSETLHITALRMRLSISPKKIFFVNSDSNLTQAQILTLKLIQTLIYTLKKSKWKKRGLIFFISALISIIQKLSCEIVTSS